MQNTWKFILRGKHMKIKDIIKILEITEGKLIADEELETKKLA